MDSDTRAAVTAVLEGTWYLLKVMYDKEAVRPTAAEQAKEGSSKEHGGASEGGAARCDHGEGGHPPEKHGGASEGGAARQQRIIFIGFNDLGQCLLPDAGGSITAPTAASLDWLLDGKRVLKVVAGVRFTLLLADDDSQLYAVGSNDHGQLGRGSSDDGDPASRVPQPVTGIGRERITLIAAGSGHCAVVTECGNLLLWGYNAIGQCGTGAAGGNILIATRCDSGALADAGVRVVFVACGYGHTVALTSDGGVVAFGSNYDGQLGTGSNDDDEEQPLHAAMTSGTGSDDNQPTPERLACTALDGVRIVGCAAGASFTHLVSDDGRVFAMGRNHHGQLGTGNTTNVSTPIEIDTAHFGGAPVAAVACGMDHTMAITRDEGKLYGWGWGASGRTGLGHTDDATTPHPVVGALADARVVRIAAGMGHSCALTEDGRVFAFGKCCGIPAAGAQGTPQLLQGGALVAGSPVCALGAGCQCQHAVLTVGTPPARPGFWDPNCVHFFAWWRRRALLMCLLRAAQRRSGGGGAGAKQPEHAPCDSSGGSSAGGSAAAVVAAAAVAAAAAAGDAAAAAATSGGEVLIRVTSLPEELWPLIFQFL